MKDTRLTLRVTDEEKEKLSEYAWKNRSTMSEVLRDLISKL